MVNEEPLADLIRRAQARYDALSPHEKAVHDDEQRRSFIRGLGGADPGPHPLLEENTELRTALDNMLKWLTTGDQALSFAKVVGDGYVALGDSLRAEQWRQARQDEQHAQWVANATSEIGGS